MGRVVDSEENFEITNPLASSPSSLEIRNAPLSFKDEGDAIKVEEKVISDPKPDAGTSVQISGDDGDTYKADVREMAKELMRKAKTDGATWEDKLDKITYVTMMASMMLLTYMMTSPEGRGWLVIFHAITNPVLCIIRYVQYSKSKSHYFLLDYCYWANYAMTIYALCWPTSPEFFLIMYATSHGTLAWATPIFRNSLVLHSVDRMTSCFIHILPMLITYTIRWHPEDAFSVVKPLFPEFVDDSNGTTLYQTEIDPDFYSEYDTLTVTILYMIVGSTIAFAVQQYIYGFIVNILPKYLTCMTVVKDKEVITLYRYTLRMKKGVAYKITMLFGEKHRLTMWFLWNVFFAMCTSLPTVGFYYSQTANFVFVVFIAVIGTWNGAGFYIEVFSILWLRQRAKRMDSNHPREAESLI